MCAHPSSSFADPYAEKREQMVKTQIIARGITDARVLSAMRTIPRHEFVPSLQKLFAYNDCPLSIGKEQTISQPYIVALMSELLELDGSEKVLEIGTGSGYQAAILAHMGCRVYTIEIIPELAKTAQKIVHQVGYSTVQVRCADGYLGWEEEAPFDAIIITAAAPHIPSPLITQLKINGRMVVPLNTGLGHQMLQVLVKTAPDTITQKDIIPVRFVPLVRAE